MKNSKQPFSGNLNHYAWGGKHYAWGDTSRAGKTSMRRANKLVSILSVITMLALSACASKQTETVLVEDFYSGGEHVSRTVIGDKENHQRKAETLSVEGNRQPENTVPKAVTRVEKKTKKANPNNYQQRRVVSVIPDNGSIYVKSGKGSEKAVKGNGIQKVISRFGENHTVYIAQDFPNMIITPFESAKAMGMDSKDYDMGNNGKAILIKPKLGKKLWISITDANNSKSVPISLTLVPKKGINSQTIIASVAHGSTNDAAAASAHTQSVSDILKSIANKKLPSDFVVKPLHHVFEMGNGISVKPVEHYAGNDYDVYRYRLTNMTGQRQVLAEEMFAHDRRVVAVSFFPKTVLEHGQSTDVLIMVGKLGE